MGNTILLADKSITIQKIVELTFADEDYTIKCVNDGQSALEIIPQISPDIILADISLPVKNGYELCRAIRTDPSLTAYSQIPVILLAGIYETMDEDRAKLVQERVREVGGNDLLSKPFDPQALTAKVKEFLFSVPIPHGAESVEQPSSGQNIFAESPAPSDSFFASFGSEAAEEPTIAQPPDDSEKTMMLPEATKMFAETPPFAEDTKPGIIPQEHLALEDTVKPQDEPVFDEQEMAAMPAADFAPVPDDEPVAAVEEPQGNAFMPAEESEFVMPPEPEAMSGHTPMSVSASAGSSSVIAPSDDPFGDVFGEAASVSNWSASASEEEAPFGELTPPPPPPAPEPEPEAVHDDAGTMPIAAVAAPTEEWMAPSAEPVAEEEFPLPEAQHSEGEDILEPSMKPDFGEDTWSRAQAQV
ncbi:MAG: hypothetical protein C5B54_09500, partial [Acidobacteria bacterium]